MCGYHEIIYLHGICLVSVVSLFVHTVQVPKHFTTGYTSIIRYVTIKTWKNVLQNLIWIS